MYLSGSKWNLRKKRKRPRPWRILALLVLIAGGVYIWQIYVPAAPPLFIPTPTPTRSPASFVLEAESFFDSGRLDQAQAAYLEAIKANPRESDHYVALARVRMFMGDFSGAEQAARDALVLEPNLAIAHAYLGWALDFRSGELREEDPVAADEMLAEALQEVEKGYDINPNIAEVRAFYAEVLLDRDVQNYDRALENARAAISLDNTLLEAHRSLGYVWESTGNRELALESYITARSLNPNLPSLHIDVGNMLRALGDIDGARESYLNAVALSPTSTVPLTLLVNLYAGVGEYGVASQYARQAVELNPANPRLRGNLGRMYYHNGALEEAIAQFNFTIRGGQTPENVWVEGLSMNKEDFRILEYYYTYGLALAKQGICEEAIQIFEAILTIAPEDEIAAFNAEEGLIICGQLERPPTPEAEGSDNT